MERAGKRKQPSHKELDFIYHIAFDFSSTCLQHTSLIHVCFLSPYQAATIGTIAGVAFRASSAGDDLSVSTFQVTVDRRQVERLMVVVIVVQYRLLSNAMFKL